MDGPADRTPQETATVVKPGDSTLGEGAPSDDTAGATDPLLDLLVRWEEG